MTRKFKTKLKGTSRPLPVRPVLEELTKRLYALEEASDTNATLFVDSIALLELQCSAQRMVIDDLLRGKVIKNGDDIAWRHYFELVAKKQEAEDKEKKSEDGVPRVLSPDAALQEEVIVFGGG